MTWVAVGVAGAGLVGSMISSNAASNAASGARNSANAANQMTWDMFQQQQQNQAPWLSNGSAALGALGNAMGFNSASNFDERAYLHDHPSPGALVGNGSAYADFMRNFGMNSPEGAKYFSQGPGFGSMTHDFSTGDYQADPGYQFRLEQGAKALERSGAAKGMSLSGAQMKGLTDYNSGMASQEYGNAYNRFMNNRSSKFNELASIAGLGQTANGQLGQMGMNTAQYMGNNTMGAATAAGNAGMASAGMWGNALNTGANTWMQYNAMNQNPGAYSITGTPGSSSPNFGNNWGQPVPYATGG